MANKNFYTQFANRSLLIGADGKNGSFYTSGKIKLKKNEGIVLKNIKNE